MFGFFGSRHILMNKIHLEFLCARDFGGFLKYEDGGLEMDGIRITPFFRPGPRENHPSFRALYIIM